MMNQSYKIIAVGRSGVGKTTIIQRLIKGTYKEENQSTIGVEFNSYVCNVDGKDMKLQIWDTAGQDKFRSMTKSYFRNAVGAFLVFDVTSQESFDDLSGWLTDIQELSHPNSVIILVGNKCDLFERLISSSEARSFADRHGLIYLETSAKTGSGISDSFLRMAREINNRVGAGQLTLPNLKVQPMKYTDTQGTIAQTSAEGDQCGC